MNPGDSKAMEGIQNVERANGGEVDHDSGDEADEPNGGVSLEEVHLYLFLLFQYPLIKRKM